MVEVVGQLIGCGVVGITLVELCLPHGDLACGLAFFNIFLMEQFQGHTCFLQFLMDMWVVRITVHCLIGMLFRIEKLVRRRLVKVPDILKMDPLLVSNAEHITDRVP